jgi:predicted enzyme related to lactoylglutathione lyase
MVTTVAVGSDFRPKEPGAINGGMFERAGILQSPVLVINVDEIKAAIERVKGAGGQIVKDPQQVGDMGIVCYFKDPEDNVLGLWQALKR